MADTPAVKRLLDACLAPKSLAPYFRPGAVFLAEDKAIAFPLERAPGAGPRTEHEHRHVIIVQESERCRSGRPVTILVAPCSASHTGSVPPYELEIPEGIAGFTKSAVAFVSQIQPVLKVELVKHLGDLPLELAEGLFRRVDLMLGRPTTVPSVMLGSLPAPRPPGAKSG